VDGVNPYLPPQAAIGDGGLGAPAAVGDTDAEPALPAWRLEGRTLFARHGATLPDICLFTGEPTKPAQRRWHSLSWALPWFKVVIVFAPLLGGSLAPALAAMTYTAMRRSSNIEAGLGPAGQRRHRLGVLLSFAATIDFLALLLTLGKVPGLAGLLLLALIVLISVVLVLRVFSVSRIDRRYAHIRLRPRVAAAFARLPPPA
jgi:hypothetical protein